MAKKKKKAPVSRKPVKISARLKKIPIFIPVIVAILVVFGIASVAVAATQEEKDSFCTSCHTQPESTYFSRAQAAAPVDMASFHQKKVHCIDCHSGQGAVGRASAMTEGALNAVAYFSHTAQQPGKIRGAYPQINCIKCHTDTWSTQDMEQHYHAFLSRWQAADPTAATCIDCHPGHDDKGDATIAFLERDKVQSVCQHCHSVLRQE